MRLKRKGVKNVNGAGKRNTVNVILIIYYSLYAELGTARVDTRVSFVQYSREFHAKRVAYFAKKCTLFREISCVAKLVLACESQFRMFRISRNKHLTYETKLQSQKMLFS